VHRQLPSLATLKSAARQSLDWLWEWYWSQLDSAFKSPSTDLTSLLSHEEVKTELQAILKSYIRARKTEIKTSRKSSVSEAAQTALATYTTLLATSSPHPTHQILLDLLVSEKAILPSDKKLGSSMSGAFLVWTPLLLSICSALSSTQTSFVEIVVERLTLFMNARGPFGVEVGEDPAKEGMHAWLLRVITSGEWLGTRAVAGRGNDTKFVEHILSLLFLTPSYWNLKTGENMLEVYEDLPGREGWMSVLGAAREQDEEMETEEQTGEEQIGEEQAGDVDLEQQVQGELKAEAEGVEVRDVSTRKESGPRKRVGMWRATYIGTLPVGWEDDE
jgi:ribosomal biogenesis protein LAS1